MLSSTLRLSVSRRLVSPLVLRPATPSTSSRPFSVLVDPSHATETTPQFVVGVNNGFLPRQVGWSFNYNNYIHIVKFTSTHLLFFNLTIILRYSATPCQTP